MRVFRSLKSDIAARLAAHASFNYVHVIQQAPRSADGEMMFEEIVEKATLGQVPANGKVGLCCIVFAPQGSPQSVQNLGVEWQLKCAVRIVENKALNDGAEGTGIAAEDLLEDAMLDLQRWQPIPGKVCVLGDFYTVELDNPELWAWEFMVMCKDAGKGDERVAVPSISAAGLTVTITCATSGAAIYFTIDGTLPTPDNGTLYTAPFDADGWPVRACAYKAGMSASDGAYFAG